MWFKFDGEMVLSQNCLQEDDEEGEAAATHEDISKTHEKGGAGSRQQSDGSVEVVN
jgi:hypothetical protein